jgi:HEAT repeat protein
MVGIAVTHGTIAQRVGAIAIAAHRGDAGPALAGRADADPFVRAAALGALARLDALDDDIVRAALADPEPRVRRCACEVAATRSSAPVLSALHDPEPLVAEAAAWALGEHGDQVAPGAVDALVAVVRTHSDALVREAAAAALGAIGDPAALPAILDALGDVVTVRRRAVLALAPFDGPDVRAALERAAHDRDWQVRNAARDLLPFTSAD